MTSRYYTVNGEQAKKACSKMDDLKVSYESMPLPGDQFRITFASEVIDLAKPIFDEVAGFATHCCSNLTLKY